MKPRHLRVLTQDRLRKLLRYAVVMAHAEVLTTRPKRRYRAIRNDSPQP